jgi:hypothetical protein
MDCVTLALFRGWGVVPEDSGAPLGALGVWDAVGKRDIVLSTNNQAAGDSGEERLQHSTP